VTHAPFDEALRPHYGDALNYCRALCARWSPSEAEDVLQEALLKAFEHYRDLEHPERFRAWLFQIITRTFYSALRRAFWKRFLPIQTTPEVERMPAVYERPERYDDHWILRHALAQLPTKPRAALLLFEIGGFSLEEIATMQGDGSASAVKSRLSRARRTLQRCIQQAEAGRAASIRIHGRPAPTSDLNHETILAAAQAGDAVSQR